MTLETKNHKHSCGYHSVIKAHETLVEEIRERRNADGYWEGRLSNSALSTATAITALSFFLELPDADQLLRETAREQVDSGLNWLLSRQNEDGGWGDTDASYSNISTSMLVIAAVTAAKRDESPDWLQPIAAARVYVDRHGGVDGIRKRYGTDKTFSVPILANAAMAGLVPWREVASLPFEATLIPQKFFHWLNLPVVSYAIPALVAIGQVKHANAPSRFLPLRWLRNGAVRPSLKLLERMQPASGGFLEAVPLTSFVAMGLIKAGRGKHPVVARCIKFIIDSYRAEGSWPIDTNLATWNTSLTINSLASHWPESMSRPDDWQTTLNWLLKCQYVERHPFTNAAPGGWGWTNLTGAVPDADDTPGALLAIKAISQNVVWPPEVNQRIERSAEAGCRWLLDLQNRDGGWPTFCKGWGRLPFDRSGADITAHVIRGLLAWRERMGCSERIDRAVERGFRYLARKQHEDGSWLPLWFGNQDMPDDINPCYGTGKVLLAYRDAGRFHTKEAQNGLHWLRRNQHSDGSWGGGVALKNARAAVPADRDLGIGSLEETAICLEALISFAGGEDETIRRGVDWLILAIENGEYQRSRPIGFYFAKLWYDEQHYPLVFGLSALSRFLSKMPNSPLQP
ncbi:MAG: prenyltransferase/squalene oxidase repeat-containing protein [Pirellulaceae bacterium]